MRVILFTGKGGVGKTTIAAATGIIASNLGYKTIVLSTDAAHSLSDSFAVELGPSPTLVKENLWGQELDIQEEIKTRWGTISNYMSIVLSKAGVEDVVSEELAIIPGMEEITGLFYVEEYDKNKKFDLMLIDCAPTGESLRLLTLPDSMLWYIGKVFALEKKAAKLVRPIAHRIIKTPLPGEDVMDAYNELSEKIKAIKNILTDKEKTTIRMVLNPEKMVIKEGERAFTYFCLFGYNVDAIYCNKEFPSSIQDLYFENWKSIQQKYIEKIKLHFYPIPIFEIEYYKEEIFGIEHLKKMGNDLYKNEDPIKVFHQKSPIEVINKNNEKYLAVTLPFISKDKIDIHHHRDELIIRIGNFKRNIILPKILQKLKPKEAQFEENKLMILFS